MSRAAHTIEIEYPESDGLPMGESDPHRRWMSRVIDLLEHRYRDDSDVYVSGNMLLYYEEGNPRKHLSPDAFVVKGCEKRERNVFKTWDEGRVPNVVFELSSETTFRRDKVEKPEMYANIGVAEYFLYDHTGTWLSPPLQGLQLVGRKYVPVEPDDDGRILSRELGLTLERDEDGDLVLRDAATGEIQMTAFDAAEARREQAEAEREQAEAERDRERSARQAAEAEIARLRELLGESDSDDE